MALSLPLVFAQTSSAQILAQAPSNAESDRIQNVAPEELWKRVTHCAFPTHPRLALDSGIAGTVDIGLGISPDGDVGNYRVLDGKPLLVQSAVDAIRQRPNVVQGDVTWSRARALVRSNAGAEAKGNEASEVGLSEKEYAQKQKEHRESLPADVAAVMLPAYPGTAGGLEALVGDIFRASKKNDTATYNALISSLSQPVQAEWFRNTFGDDGDTMLKDYPVTDQRLTSGLQAFFVKMRNEKFTRATAQKHEASCDDNSGELIYPVMVMRQRPVPLYELRFHEGVKFYRLWALAYVDGGFRYLGDLHPPDFRGTLAKLVGSADKSEDSSNALEKYISVGGNVTATKLVHSVQPEYPDTARRERLQGVVKLYAIIAKDGTIRLLRVQTGYCSLAEAAIKAVRQWRYTPTLLEGKPVDVDTTIEVTFSLGK